MRPIGMGLTSRKTSCRLIRGASPISTSVVPATMATMTSGVLGPTALPVAKARTRMSARGPSNDARLHADRAGGHAVHPVARGYGGGPVGGDWRGDPPGADRGGGHRHLPSRRPRAGRHPQPRLRGEGEERRGHRRAPCGRQRNGHAEAGGRRPRDGRSPRSPHYHIPAGGVVERSAAPRRDGRPGLPHHGGSAHGPCGHPATRRVRRRGSTGFTLLEVLVAMVILSVAIVTFIQLASQGLRLLRLSGEHQEAVMLADRLARAADVSRESMDTGREGPYEWERRTRLVVVPLDLAPAGADAARLLALWVAVKWGSGRSVEVSTLRLAQATGTTP